MLVVLLNGSRIGNIYQGRSGTLRFVHEDSWRENEDAYPLSLSVPLAAAEHRDAVVTAFLWGLLPDNERTLDHFARLFNPSARNPVALLRNMGADCAGAVQIVPPESADDTRAAASTARDVEWLNESDVEKALRMVQRQSIPGSSRRTAGQFSLAGAQPKIALLEEDDRWGRPGGRTPTNRILKPPSGKYRGFAENEHLCVELAADLELGVVRSRVMTFGTEVAIVLDRFDRIRQGKRYIRIHQEDLCQALGVMPTMKYGRDGGPGVSAMVSLLRETSLDPVADIERFIRVTAVNWVIAATDAHAKNYALLHGPGGGIRLSPLYDILSDLPYTDAALHRVKLAMKIGSKYLVNRVNPSSWESFAILNGLPAASVVRSVASVLERLPAVIGAVAQRSIDLGLESETIERLKTRLLAHTRTCAEILAAARSSPQ